MGTVDIGHANVLLIDNEEFLVRLWKDVLEKHGCKVTGYTDVGLALEDFRKRSESYDIVVTDQSMPYMTGIELAAELVKLRNDIKIIVCTGYIDETEKILAVNNGICAVLIKPFNNATLIQNIEEIYQGGHI
jgi:DNA-binding response OmpR family regulator